MASYTEEFFDSKDKHPWSRIKDRILGSYMMPYTAKVIKRGFPLLYIDAFAGPGKTDDGEAGSPLLICQAAEKYAKGNYEAYFVNKEEKYHLQLKSILHAGKWDTSATPIHGDSQELLKAVIPTLSNQSVFIYIDPFGLNCEFETLEPFLNREPKFSTEILINLHMPILHRLAARDAYLNGTGDPDQIRKWHEKLTRTLGGDYWKDILLSTDEGLYAKLREKLLVDEYRKRLSSTGYLTYTGACPVQASRDSVTKYYMIFASPHPDAMVILNDAMCKAFNEYMHEQDIEDTLFAGQHWSSWRDLVSLEKLLIDYVSRFPGRTRDELWRLILQDHFMIFTHSEYIKVVKNAVNDATIVCSTPYPSSIRPTKQLNGNCVLNPT